VRSVRAVLLARRYRLRLYVERIGEATEHSRWSSSGGMILWGTDTACPESSTPTHTALGSIRPMKGFGLLLAHHIGRRRTRGHDGQKPTLRSQNTLVFG
jgi:hypothetical protein